MAAIDTSCEVDGLANSLYTSLISDIQISPTTDMSDSSFTYNIDSTSELYSDVTTLSLDDLTEVDLEGDGVFDKLMSAVDLHINREFKNSRITGDQYANVYTNVMSSVLAQSTQFLLTKEQAKWSAISAQMTARVAEIQATTALVELERAKISAQKDLFDMKNSSATYALTKMEIANADANHCLIKADTGIKEYQLNNTLPLQQATAQYNFDYVLPTQYEKEKYTVEFQLPAQVALINEQKEVQLSQTQDIRSDGVTPIKGLVGRQSKLISEQYESERAKTMNTRSDNVTLIYGSVGKQKDLYTQQIDSFVKDAKHKAAKMWLDGWITQKTLDENLASPTELEVPSVSEVLSSIRTENNL
jgi:hypothetical protein